MNKKGQNYSIQTVLHGGVPLALVLFGIVLISYSIWFGGNIGHFILGLLSIGGGIFLFIEYGKS